MGAYARLWPVFLCSEPESGCGWSCVWVGVCRRVVLFAGCLLGLEWSLRCCAYVYGGFYSATRFSVVVLLVDGCGVVPGVLYVVDAWWP